MPPGQARRQRCAARPLDEPALWDCRQSSRRRGTSRVRALPAAGAAWVIIGTLVSLPRQRLVATLAALVSCAWAGLSLLVAQAGADGAAALSPTLAPST